MGSAGPLAAAAGSRPARQSCCSAVGVAVRQDEESEDQDTAGSAERVGGEDSRDHESRLEGEQHDDVVAAGGPGEIGVVVVFAEDSLCSRPGRRRHRGKPHVRQHARDRRRRFRCAAAERQQAESRSTAPAAPPSVQCSLEQMQVVTARSAHDECEVVPHTDYGKVYRSAPVECEFTVVATSSWDVLLVESVNPVGRSAPVECESAGVEASGHPVDRSAPVECELAGHVVTSSGMCCSWRV